MKRLLAAAAAFGVAGATMVAAPAVFAHHSFTMFDRTKTATISGTVREFQWTNPHAYIQVTVREGNRDVEYSMEMGAPMYLYARGWRPRTLRPGMAVRVDYNPLRNGDPGGVVLDVKDAAGNAVGTNR